MAVVSLDGLLQKVPSKFNLVMVAAKRARQIKDGAPKLVTTESVNPVTIAMEEILAGRIVLDGTVAHVLDEEGRPMVGAAARRSEELLALNAGETDAEDAPLDDSRLDAIVEELFGEGSGPDDPASDATE